MSEDNTVVRERLRTLIQAAEKDPNLHQELKTNMSAVLEKYGLQVNQVSNPQAMRSDDDGCADLTCFTSMCPATCYVTVCSPSAMDKELAASVINVGVIGAKAGGAAGGAP
jgi:hypothetical protein